MYIGLHVKYQLLWSNSNQSLIFLTDFFKNIQMSNVIKKFVQWEPS